MNLNDLMEFDHVIRVLSTGVVIGDVAAFHAPELRNGELDPGSGWTLLSGYTGQVGGGTVMHNSEFIGGRLADDIRAVAGYYVAVVCYWEADTDDGEAVSEGWAVAFREH